MSNPKTASTSANNNGHRNPSNKTTHSKNPSNFMTLSSTMRRRSNPSKTVIYDQSAPRDTKEEFLSRDIHDFFNLIVLIPIVVLDILNWDWHKLNTIGISGKKDMIPFDHAFTGDYFDLLFQTFTAYMLIDLVWIMAIPQCVRSPKTIIIHHIAVLLYLILPTLYPRLNFIMAILVSVEMNTWFTIARRVFNKQRFKPFIVQLPFLPIIEIKFLSLCFYISWFAIRVILYPYIYYVFYSMIKGPFLIRNGIPMWVIVVSVVFHTGLCTLNCSWTYDLFRNKTRQWYNNESTKIVSGL